MIRKYDVVVIGAGPAGESAAIYLGKHKKKVAIIEKEQQVGGNYVHKGTVPSKALRHIAQQMYDCQYSPLFTLKKNLNFQDILYSGKNVIQQQAKIRQEYYQRNDVELIKGTASFLTPQKILLHSLNKETETIIADYFVIAVGSRPYRPADIDFSSPKIFDSDTILTMENMPKSAIIYGAGVIGNEYTSIFRTLGIHTTLINEREKLLSFLDDEIIHALYYNLQTMGVRIHHKEKYESISIEKDQVILSTQSKKKIKGDILLWANGRAGNTQELCLNNINIHTDSRSLVKVNKKFQTEHTHIYAIGDVIGHPSLGSVSHYQGRMVGRYINGVKPTKEFSKFIPAGIYTSPEISAIGDTEEMLTSKNIPYVVGRSWFRTLVRAQITGQKIGMLKIIFHRESLELLGIHCFGDQATEIIHIGQTIMAQTGKANSIKFFVDLTFNYPTMAEAYRVAALNGLNQL